MFVMRARDNNGKKILMMQPPRWYVEMKCDTSYIDNFVHQQLKLKRWTDFLLCQSCFLVGFNSAINFKYVF